MRSMRWMSGLFAFVAFAGGMDRALAESCSAVSGPQTAALVELYTSEGCDSCPPADRWLRTIAPVSIKAGRVVPIALHVDYWDYIGWKDPFAKPIFTARQRELARLGRSSVIYTPQVMLGARDYRTWSTPSRFDADVKRINETPAKARITLSLERAGSGVLTVHGDAEVPNASDRADAALYVTLVESGLTSQVRAGENKGVTLAHDHVVREWWGPLVLAGEGRAELTRTYPRSETKSSALGLAAFVQDQRSGSILQAVALANCP
jgi:hypothetical protein